MWVNVHVLGTCVFATVIKDVLTNVPQVINILFGT